MPRKALSAMLSKRREERLDAGNVMCLPPVWAMATNGEKPLRASLVPIRSVLSASVAAWLNRRLASTTSNRTKVTRNCSGIAATGSHFAGRATAKKPHAKMAVLETSGNSDTDTRAAGGGRPDREGRVYFCGQTRPRTRPYLNFCASKIINFKELGLFKWDESLFQRKLNV